MEKKYKEYESVESMKRRRERKIERIQALPVLPLACKWLFLAMVALTLLAVLADWNAYLRFGAEKGAAHLLKNIAVSGSSVWGICSAAVIAMSAYQLRRIGQGYEEPAPMKKTLEDIPDNQRYDPGAFLPKREKPTADPRKKYVFYCWVCGIGCIAWGALLAAVMLL